VLLKLFFTYLKWHKQKSVIMPVTLATLEVVIRRIIMVRGRLGEVGGRGADKVNKTLSQPIKK
jgi:hypothetical protein